MNISRLYDIEEMTESEKQQIIDLGNNAIDALRRAQDTVPNDNDSYKTWKE